MNNKWFAKQAGLHIAVFEEPYFSYFLKLYNVNYLWEIFNKEKSWLESNYHKCKDDYIAYVQHHTSYQKLLEFNQSVNYSETSNLFMPQNNNKNFTSYDMVEANLNVLRAFDPALVHNCSTWKELSDKIFYGSKFLQECKYARQVIFGNLLPKRQRLVQKNVMSKLQAELNISKTPVMSTPDELVFEKDHKVISSVNFLDYDFPIRTTFFDLDYCDYYYCLNRFKFIDGMDDWCLEYEDLEIKCCEKSMFAQAFKEINNWPINDMDKTFEHNGRLVRYL